MRLDISHKDSRFVNGLFKLAFVLIAVCSLLLFITLVLGRFRPSSLVAYEGYHWTRRDIYLLDLASGIHVNLTQSDSDEYGPTWNADGTRLAFRVVLNNAGGSIMALDLGTFTMSTLSGESAQDDAIVQADWAADGEDHAFLLGYGQMWMNRHDGHVIPVGYGFSPTLSPDGHSILYYADSPGDLNAEVYVYDVSAQRIRNLSQHRAHDWSPVWSRNGEQIAFLSTRDGNAEIYLMTVACTVDADCDRSARRMTTSRESELNLTWSPDGREIIFVRDSGATNQLFVLDVDSGSVRQLTSGTLNRRAPIWKP